MWIRKVCEAKSCAMKGLGLCSSCDTVQPTPQLTQIFTCGCRHHLSGQQRPAGLQDDRMTRMTEVRWVSWSRCTFTLQVQEQEAFVEQELSNLISADIFPALRVVHMTASRPWPSWLAWTWSLRFLITSQCYSCNVTWLIMKWIENTCGQFGVANWD